MSPSAGNCSRLGQEGCRDKGGGMGGDANTNRGRREGSEGIIYTAREQSHVQELFCTVCRDHNCLRAPSWALGADLLPQSAQTRLKPRESSWQ